MPEYISRETALAEQKLYNIYASTEMAVPVEALRKISTADVVEVVHCRDCEHYDCEDGDQKCVKDAEWSEEDACYYGFISYHGPEFFCADGERKEGGQENERVEAMSFLRGTNDF